MASPSNEGVLTSEPAPIEPPYSIYSNIQKKLLAWIASLAAFTSPISSSVYYPALTVLATDLNTSLSNINLTITTYMIFQGVAPTFIGGFSDRWGRRPAYLVCFVFYIAANTGLALQTSYAALLILRMLQSSGSSGTTALSSGVVSDVATRSERGSYIGIAALGSSLGPTIGPLIGGVLIHFLGWRSVFWFLDIYAGVMLLIFIVVIPETCRNIVGNGSVPPQKWNYSLISYLQNRKLRKEGLPIFRDTVSKKRRPGLLSSIPIILSRESFLLLIYAGILYAGFYIVLTGLPKQLETTFGYNSIQVGLCYIPSGAGAIAAKQVTGRLVDWNFRRHARRLNIRITGNRQTNIDGFPIERARLEIGLPMAYLGCISIIPYGWIMNMASPPLPAALIMLFFQTFSLSASNQVLNVLIVDCYPESPSSASAAGNLIRCLLGAGGVALVEPLLNKIGVGWTSTLTSLTWVVCSLCWWSVWIWGPDWRKEKRRKADKKRAEEKELERTQDIQMAAQQNTAKGTR